MTEKVLRACLIFGISSEESLRSRCEREGAAQGYISTGADRWPAVVCTLPVRLVGESGPHNDIQGEGTDFILSTLQGQQQKKSIRR